MTDVGGGRGPLEDRSEASVRAALALVIPELADADIVLNPWFGQHDEAYWASSAIVGGTAIVKFAWSATVARRRHHEGAVLRALHDAGRPGLPLPVVLAASAAPALVVTRLVPGVPLSAAALAAMSDDTIERAALALVEAITALQDPALLAAVEQAGVVLASPLPQATTDAVRADLVPLLDPDRATVVEELCAWTDEVLASEVADPDVLVHGDLHSYNLVWDPTDGRLAAVVDFEQASRGDPAFDFRYLSGLTHDIRFFAAVLRHDERLRAAAGRPPLRVDRAMAWHVRTVLGDARWRTLAGVPLPDGGTNEQWVDSLRARIAGLELGPGH